jgi:hypothetical protein
MTRTRMLRRMLPSIAAALLVGAGIWYRIDRQRLRPLSQETEQRLRSVVVGGVAVKEVPIQDILKRANDALAANRETHCLQVCIWEQNQPTRGFRKRRIQPGAGTTATPGLEPIPGALPVNDDLVTLSLHDVTCYDLLLYTTSLSESSLAQIGNTIYVVKGVGTFEPIVKRTYTQPVGRWTRSRIAEDDEESAETFLSSCGVTFYEGTSARLTNSERLTVYNTPAELDLCDTLFSGHDVTIIERMISWIRWHLTGT